MGLLFQNDEGITFASDEICSAFKKHCLAVLLGPVGLHISANTHFKVEFTI